MTLGRGTISLRTVLSMEAESQSRSRLGTGRQWKQGRSRALEGGVGAIPGLLYDLGVRQ